jgi:hypothetical protein
MPHRQHERFHAIRVPWVLILCVENALHSSAENGSVGADLCFGALTLAAGFRSIHRACSQNRKNARICSRFFVAYTAPSSHVVLNSRIAPTSICFSSRKPFYLKFIATKQSSVAADQPGRRPVLPYGHNGRSRE